MIRVCVTIAGDCSGRQPGERAPVANRRVQVVVGGT
jgi:hypothetical protein